MAQHETPLLNNVANQVLTGNLTHFTIDFIDTVTTYNNDPFVNAALQTLATRATIVMLGAVNSFAIRVAVENSSDWTAADLQTALRALTVVGTSVTAGSVTAVAFVY